MNKEELFNLITPRQFVEELENFDSSNMKFSGFESDDEKVFCKFKMFSDNFLNNTILNYDKLIYDTLTCDNLSFQEKIDYFNNCEKIFNNKEYEERCKKYMNVNRKFFVYEAEFKDITIPLVYKKNNICRFQYISYEPANRSGKVFIK
ncbi:MAG TPA: hypothetical protein PLH46_06330 [Caldisericia bacterium]|nr:hypothetical protein [Caldisericia bacterium]